MRNKKIIYAVSSSLAVAMVCFSLIALLVFTRQNGSEKKDGGAATPGAADELHRNYLLLGKDRASGLTDVMMIVSVDSKKKNIGIVQIPRDTYAKYGDGSYRKLNGALASLGADGLCEFIEENMAVGIDGYFVFDLDVFSMAVDAIGGVEIELPFDMEYTDKAQGLRIKLEAGKCVLDGEAAEQFVRYRSGYVAGDVARLDAQKIFMSAFIRNVKQKLTVASAISIAGNVLRELKTNVKLSEISELAVCCFDVSEEDVSFLTLAGREYRSEISGAWFYVLSKSSSARLLADYAGGNGDESEFDPKRVFVGDTSAQMNKIYLSDIEYEPRNSKDISENGIDITLN